MAHKVQIIETIHKEHIQLRDDLIAECIDRSRFLKSFILELEAYTATNLACWVDTIVVGYSEQLLKKLDQCGYINQSATCTMRSFMHPENRSFHVVMLDNPIEGVKLSLRVESIADFCFMHGMKATIEGDFGAELRQAIIAKENGIIVELVERRSLFQLENREHSDKDIVATLYAEEIWKTRSRIVYELEEEEEAYYDLLSCAESLVHRVGRAEAATILLAAETRYWQKKNRAGQLFCALQENEGLGLVNASRLTFRTLRKGLEHTVRFFEILGFHIVEQRFEKTTTDVGIGIIVLEQKKTGHVVEVAVDALKRELDTDIAHSKLQELKKLGEVGVWCALHGESLFQAGAYCVHFRCAIEKATRFLEEKNVMVRSYRTEEEQVVEAITAGDLCRVLPQRVKSFMDNRYFGKEELSLFLMQGFPGSRMGLLNQ